MTQAATFGRRGTVAAAPAARAGPARPGQTQPAARSPAPAAKAAPKADPKPASDSLLGYFLWLLFSFRGRLDRRTYRYARIVANVIFVLCLSSLKSSHISGVTARDMIGSFLLFLSLLLAFMALMAWTTLAMQVKRRHDRDKGWAWLFVGFIPIIGPIWVLVETCWLDGTPGYNRFDDPAKAAAAVF